MGIDISKVLQAYCESSAIRIGNNTYVSVMCGDVHKYAVITISPVFGTQSINFAYNEMPYFSSDFIVSGLEEISET